MSKNRLVMTDKKRKDGGVIKSMRRYKYEIQKMGKLGPASPVRIIDPSTVDLSKYLENK